MEECPKLTNGSSPENNFFSCETAQKKSTTQKNVFPQVPFYFELRLAFYIWLGLFGGAERKGFLHTSPCGQSVGQRQRQHSASTRCSKIRKLVVLSIGKRHGWMWGLQGGYGMCPSGWISRWLWWNHLWSGLSGGFLVT